MSLNWSTSLIKPQLSLNSTYQCLWVFERSFIQGFLHTCIDLYQRVWWCIDCRPSCLQKTFIVLSSFLKLVLLSSSSKLVCENPFLILLILTIIDDNVFSEDDLNFYFQTEKLILWLKDRLEEVLISNSKVCIWIHRVKKNHSSWLRAFKLRFIRKEIKPSLINIKEIQRRKESQP